MRHSSIVSFSIEFYRNCYDSIPPRTGFQKEDFSIEVFVTNLLDNDDYLAASRQIDFSNGFDFTQQGVVVTPARRRQVGIRASLTFR